MSRAEDHREQPAEQQRYARMVAWGTHAGLVVLLLSFAAYVSGWLPSSVPPGELVGLWTLPSADYVRQAGTPVGWGWLGQLRHGDVAALLGIAILAGCSVLALLGVLPLYARRGERAFVALVLLQIAIIVFAAWGG
jgi:hypothetical protein